VKCPVEGSDLVMTERQGVEIDYCPQCRGVWLDRGELDKILDRAARMQSADVEVQRPAQRQRDDAKRHQPYRKRHSWLSDLFD